jgi:hypothetical protein
MGRNMKFFECADGTLIHPYQVTNCRSYQEDDCEHIAKFAFGASARLIVFHKKSDAEDEIKAFHQHCEEI